MVINVYCCARSLSYMYCNTTYLVFIGTSRYYMTSATIGDFTIIINE